MYYAAGRVNLLTSHTAVARIYVFIYLVNFTAGIKTVVISQCREIVAKLAVVPDQRGGIAPSVGAIGVGVKISSQRTQGIQIFIKGVDR